MAQTDLLVCACVGTDVDFHVIMLSLLVPHPVEGCTSLSRLELPNNRLQELPTVNSSLKVVQCEVFIAIVHVQYLSLIEISALTCVPHKLSAVHWANRTSCQIYFFRRFIV